MTEAASFSEALVPATRRHIPKDRKLDNAIKIYVSLICHIFFLGFQNSLLFSEQHTTDHFS